MNLKELLTLAATSLKANALRSLLTTLGVIIGVFAVIVLVSLGTGLQSYITNQISGLGSNLIFVIPGKVGGQQGPGDAVNKLSFPLAEYLQVRLKNIAKTTPYISKITTVKYSSKTNKNTQIVGTGAIYPEIIKTELEKGSFFTQAQEASGGKVAVIGQTVVKNLFQTKNPIGKKISISGSRFTVIGISSAKGSVFGQDQDNTIIIPLSTARKLFGAPTVSTIYIAAKEPEQVNAVIARAKSILSSRLEEDDFTLMTQEQTLSTITNITGILTVALGGIAAISLVVGGIGVMNIMLISVTERTKEIGLRKALGARREDILKQFLLEAVMLSLGGGVIGIALGLGASFILAALFVSQVTWWSVALAFAFSVVVGVVFGIAPAIRASRLSPIEALRYE